MIEEEIATELSRLMSQSVRPLEITIESRVSGSNVIGFNPVLLNVGDNCVLAWDGGAVVELIRDEDKDNALAVRVIFRNDSRR